MAGGVAALEAAAPAGIELVITDREKLELGGVGALCAVLLRPGIRNRVTKLLLGLSTATHVQ